MYTLGDTTSTVCKITEDHSINISATSANILRKGVIVKTNADGDVEAIAAATDKPFGVVVAGNREAGELVTVQTEFNSIINVVASGPLVIGDEVACASVNAEADGGLPVFIKAVATNYIVGVALSDAADGETVQIGINRVSVLKA